MHELAPPFSRLETWTCYGLQVTLPTTVYQKKCMVFDACRFIFDFLFPRIHPSTSRKALQGL